MTSRSGSHGNASAVTRASGRPGYAFFLPRRNYANFIYSTRSRRYWSDSQACQWSRECKLGERPGSTCAVGARVLSTQIPPTAPLAVSRWRARVHEGNITGALRCDQIIDKARCCATIDKTGDVCVPAATSFTGGLVCAG